jgi:thiol-disulfide isomerase/thioredoxin
MAWLGAHTEWVDHTVKKVFEKGTREVKGPGVQLAPSTKVEELSEANPYSADVAAPDYIIEPQKERDGVMCDVVVAVNGRIKVRWMFGADDHLPRWKERIIENTAAAGSMITEISNISIDTNDPPRMTPDMLRVIVPPGYAEERAAPPPPPAPAPEKAKPAAPGPTLAPAEGPKPAAAAPEPAPAVPAPPQVRVAPDFELKDAKGKSVTLASLKGSAVILEFAGTWCLPLRDAHPELDALAKDYKHLPVKVYMLDVREKSSTNAIDDTKAFAFDLLLNADPVARLYNIRKYPTYVVIDLEGNIARTEAGYKKPETMNSLREAVNQIMDRRAGHTPAAASDGKPASPSDAAPAPAASAAPAPAPAQVGTKVVIPSKKK